MRLVTALIVLVFLGIVGFVFVSGKSNRYPSVIVSGDPMVLLVLGTDTQNARIITFPTNVTIDAAHGYGAYSLGSLWRLDRQEKKSGRLFVESIEESIGYPISYFVGPTSDELVPVESPRIHLKDTFSYLKLARVAISGMGTNMNLPTFFSFVRRVQALSELNSTVVALGETSLFVDTVQPDGSRIKRIDPERVDIVLGTVLLDEEIREEAVSVSILNTTESSGLGDRMARFLGHVGAVVIEVGNAKRDTDSCIVVTSSDIAKSKTVQFLKSHFRCVHEEGGSENRAQATVFVGADYERRFLPY